MPHYFIEPSKVSSGRFILSGDEARHIIRVLRIQPGERLDLFDGTGRQYHVQVDAVNDRSIEGSVLSNTTAAIPNIKVHLFCAVPKGGRFDWLIEKSTETGVSAITPLISKRSNATGVQDAKLERWRRLSRAASKQCGRSDTMEIFRPVAFAEAIDAMPSGVVSLIPWEGERSNPIGGLALTKGSSIAIFIGPEGGFTVEEIELAKFRGIRPVTLGTSILRVETAALIASVLVLDMAGQFSNSAL